MIIYKVTNRIDDKCYIGQTVKTLKQRKSAHKTRMKKSNRKHYFYNALRKHGWDNFKWEVLCECKSKKEMDEMEFHYIKQYDSYNNGYNMTWGGEGNVGWIPSEKTKKKISDAHKGRNNGPCTDERKKNISKSLIGYKHSEETKKKISDAHKGMKLGPMSEEQKWKISKANTGKKRTKEQKQKMSEIHKMYKNTKEYKDWFMKNSPLLTPEIRKKATKSRIKNGNYGHSEETKKKISEGNRGKKRTKEDINKITKRMSKKWIIIDTNNKEFIITNLEKFCRDNKLRSGSMRNVSNGIWKQYKGWRCYRYDDTSKK